MLFWHNTTMDRPRERSKRTPAILLIISAVVATLGFSAVCGSVMWEMRRSAADLAQQSAGNLASTIESDISRNIELYDLSLRAVVDNLGMPALATASKSIMHMILFDHAATAKHFGAIQVFDANPNLTHDSTTLDPAPTNRADEAYFTVHRDNPNVGLFISRPMLHGGAYAVVLSRRISAPDGRFLGIVPGSLDDADGSDIEPLLNAGVPGIGLNQDGTYYFDVHHTPDDTLDKNDSEALRQNVAAWTAMLGVLAGPVEPEPKPAKRR